MNNVLYQPLPTNWNDYEINTDFRIGVQLTLLLEDTEVSDNERLEYLTELLFSDRSYPHDVNELVDCLNFFMNGWHHDNSPKTEKHEKVMDYYVDQGRILADFRQIYGIDLKTAEMHWWEFQWLLWSMPHDRSSFMQVLEIRTKKPRKKASSEEIKAIKEGKAIYGLKSSTKKELSDEDKAKIDAYDAIMAKSRKKE